MSFNDSIVSNDPIEQLASRLVEADREFMTQLINARVASGLSVEVVAERMGVSADSVYEFEHYNANPRLSMIRRYSLAIGALVTHTMTPGAV